MTESSPEAGLYTFAEQYDLRPRHRYWLHALLLLATLLSTTIVGAEMAHSFAQSHQAAWLSAFNCSAW